MRVLLAHSFFHARGGDTTYARTLATGLARAGHDVAWLCVRHPANDPSPWERWFVPRRDPDTALTVRAALSTAARFAWDPRAKAAAASLIAAFRPDVVHLQHVHRHLTPSVLDAARDAGVPAVWTVHDYELVCPAGTLFTEGAPCVRCRGHRYHQAVAHRCKRGDLARSALVAAEKADHARRGLWRRVDRFLCPSQFVADTLVSFGVPADRVQHLTNGYDAPPVSDGAGEGWVFAGRLTEEKGVRVLAEAALRVATPLDVCGDGPLRALVAGVPGARLHGHLPPAAVARRLAAARVVVVPSVWWENLPYAVIEAQALGRAVVASRTGGIPELIDDGVDGVLVPPGDPDALAHAVSALLAEPDRARRLGAAAAARVRDRLALGPHVDAVLAAYRKCGARGVL